MMISVVDAHVHVGQFGANYFDPFEIGQFLVRQGVVGCVASTPVAATGKHDEAIRDLDRLMSVAGLSVWPLLWVTPGLLARHPDLDAPLRRLPYRGLKIHPRANKWSEAMLDRAFRAAEKRSIGILLHTDPDYPAGIYQDLLLQHPKVKVVLAHGRPIEQAQAVLRECPNAFVDTAFMPLPLIRGLVGQGFGDRIIFGSDAPIDAVITSDRPRGGIGRGFNQFKKPWAPIKPAWCWEPTATRSLDSQGTGCQKYDAGANCRRPAL